MLAGFLGALLLSLILTPLFGVVARRLNFLDQPSNRKLHKNAVPLLGGGAIFVAVLVSCVLFGWAYIPGFRIVGVAAAILLVLGLLDDRKPLPVTVKFGIQILVAVGLLAVDVRIDLSWMPEWANVTLTVLWIVGVTNALNLLDSLDGLCAGVSAIAAAFFLMIAYLNDQVVVGILSAAVLGACLGFLPYNRNPARVFLGDAGSLLLGFLLAVIGLKMSYVHNVSQVTWMIPVLILAVPVFDTSLVFFSRMRNGENPFCTPGVDHTSHRLLARGLSQKRTVLLLYGAGILGGITALLVMYAKPATAFCLGFLSLSSGIGLFRRLERR
jgi:UDP-GlcNAc:undecaprenyl-phosphate GlcNAc-1-phosphate transferase